MEPQISTQTLDHYGLIASVCQQLGIAEKIDRLMGSQEKRKISNGMAAVAMIINTLGFVNNRLYLVSNFFENLPVQDLLGKEGIVASDLNDDTLGRCLDELYDSGVSELFTSVSYEILSEQQIHGKTIRLDSTSFNVHGKYEGTGMDENTIEITYGMSKDHRPDLKQFMMNLGTVGESGFPILMDPLSGNTSDTKGFALSMKRLREFQSNLQIDEDFWWIMDSKFYTLENLQEFEYVPFITRVPEVISEAKELISKYDHDDKRWNSSPEGYSWIETISSYGSIDQRWYLYFSQEAFEKESKTYLYKLEEREAELPKKYKKLENTEYESIEYLEKDIAKLQKSYPEFTIKYMIKEKQKKKGRGRPKQDDPNIRNVYFPEISFIRNEAEINKNLRTKGRFILATNLTKEELPDGNQVLLEYKSLNKTERGFRFMKDTWFNVSDVYLKRSSRVQSLMLIMTLTLLVYNFTENLIRKKLAETGKTYNNQKGKPISNPTLRWIIQSFVGIQRVAIEVNDTNHTSISNLTDDRKTIIELLGDHCMQIYRLTNKIVVSSP